MSAEPVVVDALDEAQRACARTVRRRVFVEEQGVPEALEIDALDDSCDHVLALVEGEPVGAARYRRTDAGVKLERVAVLSAQRGRGVGEAIVAHIHDRLPEGSRAYAHAQESAYGFWERVGYVAEGEVFHEADIPHRRMARRG